MTRPSTTPLQSEQTSLAVMSRASQMLAEATTIQKAKELKDLALTAADWAKRKHLGEEAIGHCRSYALLAERRLGEMLLATERAKAGRPTKERIGTRPEPISQKPENKEVAPTLAELGLSKKDSVSAQRVAKLPEKKFEALVEQTRNPPHVSQNGGDNEWYTPAEYVEAAREVLQSIDLDPASTAEANAVVKAKRFFTAEQDGLAQEWKGRIYVNPPYATELIPRFAAKVVAEVTAGHVTEAIVLVNNATETRWFQTLLGRATALCLPAGRIKFWHPRKVAVPLQGQAIFYFGLNISFFCQRFRQFGTTLRVTKASDDEVF